MPKPKSTLLTPFDYSDAVSAGRRRFWKQVLPVTQIDYDGQKIDFDSKFHKDLELSFGKAYQQVPLVFADGRNQHNESPKNWSGDIVKMENRGDQGTWALIEADKEAAKIIQRNPKMGVSARITQNVIRDGRVYKRAVRHVLMTMFPRVPNMEPWQAVDLSEDAGDLVVDLTAVDYKKGTKMGKKAKATTVTVPRADDGSIDLSELTEEEFAEMLDLAAAVAEDERLADHLDDEDEDEVEDEPEVRRTKRKKSKTKVTVEKESEEDDDEDESEEDEDTDLSETLNDIKAFRRERAEEKWETERAKLTLAGVPPFMLDLAEPVLQSPEAFTIDLSDDEEIDAKSIIREMLNKSVGLVDLSDEEGHSIDLSDKADEFEGKDLLDAWEKSYTL